MNHKLALVKLRKAKHFFRRAAKQQGNQTGIPDVEAYIRYWSERCPVEELSDRLFQEAAMLRQRSSRR